MPPENVLNLDALRLLLRPFLAKMKMMTDFPSISQVSTCGVSPAKRTLCACGPSVSVRRAMALIGYAEQGGGKSGPVESGLTGPTATALYLQHHFCSQRPPPIVPFVLE